jgi:hypothetical protein
MACVGFIAVIVFGMLTAPVPAAGPTVAGGGASFEHAIARHAAVSDTADVNEQAFASVRSDIGAPSLDNERGRSSTTHCKLDSFYTHVASRDLTVQLTLISRCAARMITRDEQSDQTLRSAVGGSSAG